MMPKQESDREKVHFDKQLDQAYRRAVYLVDHFRLQVGSLTPEFKAWLRAQSIDQFAFITARNPRSRILSDQDNDQRQEQLEGILREKGWRFLPATNEDPGREWPPEAGAFMVNCPREEALQLARQFEQNAIIWGTINDTLQLVWC